MRIAILLLFAALAFAQQKDPISWTVANPPFEGKATPGATVKVKLTAAIPEGWHLYSMKKLEGGPINTSIAIPAGQPFSLAGSIEAPDPIRLDDPVFGMEVEFYVESAEFVIPVKIADTAQPGPATLSIAPRYQTCNGSLCLPPRVVKLEIPIKISSK